MGWMNLFTHCMIAARTIVVSSSSDPNFPVFHKNMLATMFISHLRLEIFVGFTANL